jgi:hypothetical protein
MAEQAKLLDIYVRDAIYTVNEARDILGLDPIAGGDQARVYGTNGVVPLATPATSTAVGKRSRAAAPFMRATFNPDQPRVPAGNSNGGEWTGGDSGAARYSTEVEAGPEEPFQVAQEQTYQSFIAENCKASILRVFPGQFLNVPVDEVLKAAESGDAAARSAKKLLFRDKYRK